jgi:hypothetical protein
MDLNDAGKLLGITPNAVRHRAKKGQSPFDNKAKPYETDNKGKWWVFLDPDRLPPSNDTSNSSSNSGSKRPSNESKISGEIKALQGHVKTLEEALSIERAETARLRASEAESVDLKVRVAGLTEALSMERAEISRLRRVEVESVDLKVKIASLTTERDELKKAAQAPRPWWRFW